MGTTRSLRWRPSGPAKVDMSLNSGQVKLQLVLSRMRSE